MLCLYMYTLYIILAKLEEKNISYKSAITIGSRTPIPAEINGSANHIGRDHVKQEVYWSGTAVTSINTPATSIESWVRAPAEVRGRLHRQHKSLM